MSDLYSLYWMFILLCLFECVITVEGHPALVTRLFLRWRVFRSPGISLGTKKRLLFLNPAPWLAEWHVVPQLFFTPTGEGLVPASSLLDVVQGQEQHIRTGREHLFALSRDAEGRLQAADPKGEEKAEVEKKLRGCGLEGADAVTGFSRSSLLPWLDPMPFWAKRRRVRVHLVLLQVLCTAQLCTGLALAPLLLAELPLLHVIIGSGVAMYVLGLLVACVFLLAWRRLRPDDTYGVVKAIWMLLYPPASIRAIQTLSPAMRTACHESTLMLTLTGKKRGGTEYLRHALACLACRDYSLSLAPAASEALRAANSELAEAMKQHWNPGPLQPLIDPQQLEKGATCYCPMCGVSMAVSTEYCPNCREVRMLLVDLLPPV